MILTLNQLLENKKAHSLASYYNGKTHYNGKQYEWDEFNKAFPINFEKVLLGNARNYKGENCDKTKIAK